MRSVLLPGFCLLVGVVSIFPRSKAVADDQVYRSLDEAAQAAAEQLLDRFLRGEGEAKAPRPGAIGVAPLRNVETGDESVLGKIFAERLTQALDERRPASWPPMVERARIKDVQEELGFQMSGVVDPDKAKRFGQLSGAQSLVVGTLSLLENVFRADLRLVEVETGDRLTNASADWVATDEPKAQYNTRVSAEEPQRAERTPIWQIILGLGLLGWLLGGGDDGGPQAPAGFNVVIQ